MEPVRRPDCSSNHCPPKNIRCSMTFLWGGGFWLSCCFLSSPFFLSCYYSYNFGHWGVAKGSSVLWVAKLKGDKNSECKLSNGCREVTGRYICFFLQENEWSRSYMEINQHPSLPWDFMTHGFLHPSAFPEHSLRNRHRECPRTSDKAFDSETSWAPIRSGNGQNTAPRALFRKRELTESCGNFGEFRENLSEFSLVHKRNPLISLPRAR